MIDGNRLNEVVRSNIETLCRHFFPAGHKDGCEWKIADVSGAKGNSLGIELSAQKAGVWRDRATNEGGSFPNLIMRNRALRFPEAVDEISRFLGVDFKVNGNAHRSGENEITWDGSHKLTDLESEKIAIWRGYSKEFVQWLSDNELLRIHGSDSNAKIVFPVHFNGKIAGTHSRPVDWQGEGRCPWKIWPSKRDGGPGVQPLIIGILSDAETVHIFESSWDMLAVSDKLSLHSTPGFAGFCTRGTGNVKLPASIPARVSEIRIWQQNDGPGQKWAAQIPKFIPKTCRHTIAAVPEKFGDVNDWTRAGASANDLLRAIEGKKRKPKIIVRSPSEILAYEPPPGIVLVGDNHITRGSVFIIGGAPGVGKSRASVALAEAGAIKCAWFGLPAHVHFKTLIVQNENGRFRLKKEFAELDSRLLDRFVRVSEPPPFGLTFDDSEFREDLSAIIAQFRPDLLIIDPWNAAARDEKARNYQDTFNLIRQVVPAGDDGPAIGIVAHTRKPQSDERVNGRALLNLLAGSYVLGSVPRTVFVMQAASDDITDDRIVWTCCKNNDGELGKRSAWIRRNGLFDALTDFDWEAWNKDGKSVIVGVEIVPQIITQNGGSLARDVLRVKIEEKGTSRRTAYRRIDEAEQTGLIKFCKGKNLYVVS